MRAIYSRQMTEVQIRMIQVCTLLACNYSYFPYTFPISNLPLRPNIVEKQGEFAVGRSCLKLERSWKTSCLGVRNYSNTTGNEWRRWPIASVLRLKTDLEKMEEAGRLVWHWWSPSMSQASCISYTLICDL